MTRGVEIKTNPEVLEYYVDQSELDIDDLTTKNNLKSLDKWLEGTKNPTLNQLRDLSRKLQIPLGYLIVTEPIDDTPELLNFRTIDSKSMDHTSRNLIETIKSTKNQQEFVREYRKNNGFSPLEYIDKFSIEDNINEMIKYSRNLLNIPRTWQKEVKNTTPLKYFRKKLNDIGVIVQRNGIVGENTHRKLDINEFRAFVIIDVYAPLIFINTNDTNNGQLFSLIHEFGHILLGSSEIYNVNVTINNEPNQIEQVCNAYASEILVPKDLFINDWEKREEIEFYNYVSILARKYKVSKTVIARKALENNFINVKDYNEIAERNYYDYRKSQQRKKENNEGGNYYNTVESKIDPVLFNTVKSDYYEGNIQYNEALRLLNIGSRGFERLSQKNRTNEVDFY